jgi:hypothetical protein
LLPNYARRKNGYGWKMSGIMEETREEKHERMFCKAVKKRRNEYQPKLNLLKDKQGNIIGEEGKIINRCAEHFTEKLNNEHAEGLLYRHAA